MWSCPCCKKTQVSISYPSPINGVVYAGQGFSWSGSFSEATDIKTYVLSTQPISAAKTRAQDALNILVATMQAEVECAIKKAVEDAQKAFEQEVKDYSSCKQQCANKPNCGCGNAPEVPDYDLISKEAAEGVSDSYKAAINAAKEEVKKFDDCLSEAGFICYNL